jgi:hypothetical protein
MPKFQPGDYVKAEFRDEASGERMWVVVDSCDDEEGVLFGRLDNEPLLGTGLHVGDELAVSYDKVVEQRTAWEFEGAVTGGRLSEHMRAIDLRGLQWQIDKMSFSNKDTRTRMGLFMTEHPEGTSNSADRDSGATLTGGSRVLWRTSGKRHILCL